MGYTISILLDSLDFLAAGLGGLKLHGANMTARQLYRAFAADDAVDAYEVIASPNVMVRTDDVQRVAGEFLPPHRQGKGMLTIHPIHNVAEVWSDGKPRVLLCPDPEYMPTSRYFRDRFAAGPMPIVSDTHALGHHRLWPPLQRLARAVPVPFDSIVSISTNCREALRKAFDGFLAPTGSAPPCRLDQIPHHLDAERFHPPTDAERQTARAEMGLPADGLITTFLGRLTPYDKADLLPLLRVFSEVATHPNQYLLIAGKPGVPYYPEQLRQVGEQLGLGERLIIQTEVPLERRHFVFAASDIFVFPGDTIQETLGNTVLEAMATGLPVIASDWDGFVDVVRDGETGFLLPTLMFPVPERVESASPGNLLGTEYLLNAQAVWVDTRAMAGALKALLGSADLRSAMGAAGRRVIEQGYTWPRVRERWFRLLDELLAEAAAESAETRAVRRAGADALGLPTPYRRVFHHYASSVADPVRHAFGLSRTGREVLAGRQALSFYGETLPLVRPEVVRAVLEVLNGAEGTRMTLHAIAEQTGKRTGARMDDVTYHVALLLKRDLLETDLSAEVTA